MEWWIVLTIAGAFLQNLRMLLQKRLTGRLSVNGASYVRFVYALPFAWIYVFLMVGNGDWPGLNLRFAGYVLAAAVAQILATSALLAAFTYRNFAVSTALSKTEAAQAALFGLVVLGDAVSGWVLAGIGVSLVGVLLLSFRGHWRQALTLDRALFLGLASGTGFAISAVGYRGASLALDTTVPGTAAATAVLAGSDVLVRAGMVVAVAVTVQSILMGAWIGAREPQEFVRVAAAWRVAVWVGLIGMLASAGWFTAMTLKSAAVVRALGQIELLFSLATAVWIFREKVTGREIVGGGLVLVGLLLLLELHL